VRDADAVVRWPGDHESLVLPSDKAMDRYRMNNGRVMDGMVQDGLWDHVNDFHMG